jgi:hypothetical protein
MATKILSYEEIIEQARSTWTGKTGDERAELVKKTLDTMLENYHQVTGISKNEILIAFEKARNVNTVNFYQASRFPMLENIYIFDTIDDYKKAFPSGKYICPSCCKESTDPYECSQEKCDWKVSGLLGDLGKGIKVIIKDKFLEQPVPINIFKPIELVTVAS